MSDEQIPVVGGPLDGQAARLRLTGSLLLVPDSADMIHGIKDGEPYIADGIKRIPAAVRDEARRLLRHYPNVVDLKYAKSSFCSEEADKIMEERYGS